MPTKGLRIKVFKWSLLALIYILKPTLEVLAQYFKKLINLNYENRKQTIFFKKKNRLLQ